jgi:hypothetical protein
MLSVLCRTDALSSLKQTQQACGWQQGHSCCFDLTSLACVVLIALQVQAAAALGLLATDSCNRQAITAAGPYQQKGTFIGQITALTLQIMALPSVYHEITGIRVYLTLQRRHHTGNRISIG